MIPATERNVLIDLYNSTNGTTWTNNTGWNGAAGTEDTWDRVNCFKNYVDSIHLRDNNLVGSIPSLCGWTNELWNGSISKHPINTLSKIIEDKSPQSKLLTVKQVERAFERTFKNPLPTNLDDEIMQHYKLPSFTINEASELKEALKDVKAESTIRIYAKKKEVYDEICKNLYPFVMLISKDYLQI